MFALGFTQMVEITVSLFVGDVHISALLSLELGANSRWGEK